MCLLMVALVTLDHALQSLTPNVPLPVSQNSDFVSWILPGFLPLHAICPLTWSQDTHTGALTLPRLGRSVAGTLPLGTGDQSVHTGPPWDSELTLTLSFTS